MGLRSWFAGKLDEAFNPRMANKTPEAPKKETKGYTISPEEQKQIERIRKEAEAIFDEDYDPYVGLEPEKPEVKEGSGFWHDWDQIGKDVFGSWGYRTSDEKRKEKAEKEYKEELAAYHARQREVAERKKNGQKMSSAGDYFAVIEEKRKEDQKQEEASKGTSSLKQTLAASQVKESTETKTETKTQTDNKTIDPRVARELIGRGK